MQCQLFNFMFGISNEIIIFWQYTSVESHVFHLGHCNLQAKLADARCQFCSCVIILLLLLLLFIVYYIHDHTLVRLGQKYVECISSPVDLFAKLF